MAGQSHDADNGKKRKDQDNDGDEGEKINKKVTSQHIRPYENVRQLKLVQINVITFGSHLYTLLKLHFADNTN